MANTNMPAGRGRKPTKATERRKGRTNEPKYMELSLTAKPAPPAGSYTVHLLQFCHDKTSVCFGCRGQLRISGNIPQSPQNLVTVSNTRRSFMKDGQVVLQGEASNIYFHTYERCVTLHNRYFMPAFITVPEDLKPHLDSRHKAFLAEMKVLSNSQDT